jgi:hypothetical protein
VHLGASSVTSVRNNSSGTSWGAVQHKRKYKERAGCTVGSTQHIEKQ